ncbi:MAG: hypothetical protein K0S25_58 [Bacillus sp. (in: firmicutes)]|jgi:hypothetical protein|nr:hypothetical protein [Bacillus sp. (in: firmicutes)]
MNIGIAMGIPFNVLAKTGPVSVPYYTSGVENVGWVDGATLGNPSIKSKNVDHLYIKSENTGSLTVGTYVTDLVVDLTNIKTLFVEWENIGHASNNNLSYLVASTVKAGAYGTFNAQIEVANVFAKNIRQLNVTALTGNFYIRAHTRANATGVVSELKVYRVWGE